MVVGEEFDLDWESKMTNEVAEERTNQRVGVVVGISREPVRSLVARSWNVG